VNDPEAEKALADLLPQEEAARLLRQIDRLPDPRAALSTLLRLPSAVRPADPWRLLAFLTLAGHSPFLGGLLLSDPGFLDVLPVGSPDRGPRTREDLQEDLARFEAIESRRGPSAILRRFKQREYLRIALTDFLGTADLAAITRALSLLADVLVERAVRSAWTGLEGRHGVPASRSERGEVEDATFAVLALGKLGGEELNYSSDIDLLYLFSRDGETSGAGASGAGAITNREFFTRLAAEVTRLIDGAGPEGRVFRIDLGLRPGGRDGDLVISLGASVSYYRNWAEPWERQALIKVRAVAGDLMLGRRFVQAVEPLVYPAAADPYLTLEIGAMKDRIDARLGAEGSSETDIKLGRGGIREIEFAIQALQLRHGGRDGWLRQGNTLLAMHRLAEKGYLAYQEYAALARAYSFLRDLEHRLQLGQDRQTARLPAAPGEFQKLARGMRLGDHPPGAESEALARALESHRQVARAFYDSVVGQAAQRSISEEEPDLWLDRMDDGTLVGRLRAFGVPRPETTLRPVKVIRRILQAAAATPDLRLALRRAGPILLQGAAGALSPKRAFDHLETLLTSISIKPGRLGRLVSQREMLAPLVRLLGRSDLLAGWVIRQPGLLRTLGNRGLIVRTPGPETYRRTLLGSIRRPGSLTERAGRLRRRHQIALTTIALRDTQRQAGLREVLESLSHLADAAVEATMSLARSETHPQGRPAASVAILGLGRLGYRELDYGSDLDLVFVAERGIEGEAETRSLLGRCLASMVRILSTLSRDGQLYRVDLRLRPSGREGDLLVTLDSLQDYFRRTADIWELQSFLKARAVAGDLQFGERVVQSVESHLLERARIAGAQTIAGSIEEMRRRLQAQSRTLAKGPSLKLGEGGLLDVHFLVESLQLRHLVPNPPNKDTLRLLTHLHALGYIDDADFRTLHEGYLFLLALEHEIRLIYDPPLDHLPDDPLRLREIALSLYPEEPEETASARLLDSFRTHTGAIRRVYESLSGPR
jgi:[glutamine synthetase] adenylyltransferase / [glutamine synthetase]-adenylyl-L-tyrosine phosphorylase